MKELFTNNAVAKIVSLLLATLLWAVIQKSQLSDTTTSQPKPATPGVDFGVSAHGK
jgi:YbbR domain-containing protein